MSSLHTLSFEELRERNESSLEKAGFVPGGEIATLKSQKRQRIQQLLQDRSEIEDLASTQNQREAYGIEKWHWEFRRLRDVHTHPHTDLEGDEIRQRVWDKLPNSRFKRFQETFSEPLNYIVPPFDISQTGDVVFTVPVDFNQCTLAPCLVSPDRIPEKLAEDLLLCDFSEMNGDPMARLVKKRDAIPKLKLLFESSVPIDVHNLRYTVIQPSQPSVQDHYNGKASGPDPSLYGTILHTHRNGNGKDGSKNGAWDPHKLVVQHFDSAYAAERSVDHQEDSYRVEITELTTMRAKIKDINTRLNTGWKFTELREELTSEANRILEQSAIDLAHCVTEKKIEAHDLLEECKGLKDKRGKQNISAAMAQMVAVMNRIEARLKQDVLPRTTRLPENRMDIGTAIQIHEQDFRNFRHRFAKAAPLLEGESASKEQTLQELGIREKCLGGMYLQPFRSIAEHIQSKTGVLQDALSNHDRDRAIETAIQIHIIGKFQAMTTCLEHIKTFMDNPGRVGKFLGALDDLLAEKQVFPERTVESSTQMFTHMQEGVQAVKQLFFERHYDDESDKKKLDRTIHSKIDTLLDEGKSLIIELP